MRKVFSLLCLTAVLHLSVSGEKLEPVKYRKLSCGLRYFLWPSCSDPSSLQQKVCGSDNKTYASFCAFKVARCYAKKDHNTKLTLQYKGECGKPESPRMTLTKDSRRNGPFGCPILRKCDEFKGDLSCGSDGRIYMNDCHLNYTKCRGKKFLKPMPLGFCQNSRKFLPVTSCPRYCPTSSRPVCGTNRKTYESICHLDRVICALRKENNASLALYYFGACNSPATQEPCPKLEECKSAPKKPVCGSNGKTYSSLCHLRAAMCLGKRPKDHRACHAACTLSNNPKKSPGKSPQELKTCIDTCALQNADENLNLHYFGECNAPINLKPCPSRQECRIHGPRKPVCGSNRRTYRNLCIFRASSCRKTKPLKILYEEIC